MQKEKLNAIINIIAFFALIPCAISGFALKQLLSISGYQKNMVDILFFNRQEWLAIHDISSIILTILVIIHLALHTCYIKNIGKLLLKKNYDKTKTNL